MPVSHPGRHSAASRDGNGVRGLRSSRGGPITIATRPPWFTLGDGTHEARRRSITIASSPVLVHPSRRRPRAQGRPMSITSLLHSTVRVTRLLPLLGFAGCAAVSDREITYDGRPCNVLCQRWMGVGRQAPSVLTPAVPSTKDDRPPVAAHQGGVREHRPRLVERSAPHIPTTHNRPRIMPVAAPPDLGSPPMPTASPTSGWNRPLPGSSETLPGTWMPSH